MSEHPVIGHLVGKFGVDEHTARQKSTEMAQVENLFEQIIRTVLRVSG